MQTSRRTVLRIAAGLAALALRPSTVAAHPTWRPTPPRWRRSHPPAPARRRVQVRSFLGRSLWVVPVNLAAGWELLHENRWVRVRETRLVVHEGEQRELATVADAVGRLEEVEILREDTALNTVELAGGLTAVDGSAPGGRL